MWNLLILQASTRSRPLLREAHHVGTRISLIYRPLRSLSAHYRLLPSPARMLSTAQSWTCPAATHFGFYAISVHLCKFALHFGFAPFLFIFASSPCISASRHFCSSLQVRLAFRLRAISVHLCKFALHFGFAPFLFIFASSPCISASRHFCSAL